MLQEMASFFVKYVLSMVKKKEKKKKPNELLLVFTENNENFMYTKFSDKNGMTFSLLYSRHAQLLTEINAPVSHSKTGGSFDLHCFIKQ